MTPPKVAFLTHDYQPYKGGHVPGGVAWYRCFLPMHFLGQAGWQVIMSYPDFSEDNGFGAMLPEQKKTVYGFDVVVLKGIREDKAVGMVERAKQLGQRVVVDVDDLLSQIDRSNKAFKYFDPNVNSRMNWQIHEQLCGLADLVTVSTPALHDHYRSLGVGHVELVRNGVDVERYTMREVFPEKPVLGWVGATSWRSGDLWVLSSWLDGFLRQHKLSFVHAGHQPKPHRTFAESAAVSPALVNMIPGAPVTLYPRLFDHVDVGLVPLRLPLPFNEAKSCLKGLEYAAAGIPFVASPSEEYRWLHRMGIGRIAASPEEWVDHLVELLDPRVRQEEAQRHRELLVHHSSYRRGFDWLGALSLLM